MTEVLHRLRPVLVILPAAALAVGLLAPMLGIGGAQRPFWTIATLAVLAALLVEIVQSLRRGDVGLDIIAALSMSSALAVGEPLAAVVVALMYSGGQYLDDFAQRRARREMTALLAHAPRVALLHRDGALAEVALDAIEPGDRVMIRRGDVVPVDGCVADGVAVLDTSALTGESLPVRRRSGEPVMSGSTNVGEAFDLTATDRAEQSTYAGIVRLVELAQRSRAPMARMADRYALVFLGLTLAIAALAYLATGDPVRAVAVLVIATPCPLILAVPVAVVAGLSRAASQGVLIKGGRALEALCGVTTLVIDKTGTMTNGQARVASAALFADWSENEALRLAASLDQASKHVIAQALVLEARERGLALAIPADVAETPGEGIEGLVEGHALVVGGRSFVAGRLRAPSDNQDGQAFGSVTVAVAIDGVLAAEFVLRDELRTGAERFLSGIRDLGIERVVLATGDRADVARAVTEGLPIDLIRAGLTPDQKVMTVLAERKNGPVLMVGDGVNDAPALAAADVGLAIGARGVAASAEAADVILLVDHLDRILPGIRTAQRARAIAFQSVVAGIGLSLAGMIAAALGHLTPVQGALLQELIDVAVILNALRALRA